MTPIRQRSSNRLLSAANSSWVIWAGKICHVRQVGIQVNYFLADRHYRHYRQTSVCPTAELSVVMAPIFAYVVCCLIVASSAVEFPDCGSLHGSVESIVLSDCDPATMQYCPLKKGKNVSIEVTFKTTEEVTEVHVETHGIIAGIPMPFILPNPDGCKDSGLTCPLANGSEGKYKLALPIKQIYPRLQVNVKLELKDQNGQDIVCVVIPSRIV